jgi:hypothetical protein
MSATFERAKRLTGDLPWCQDNVDKLGPVVQDFTRKNESYIGEWGKRWYETFQFIYGNQSVRWSEKLGVPLDYDFARRSNPGINCQSSTNISRTIYEALKSLVFSSVPDWDASTEEEDHRQGRRFQKICQKLLDCYAERLDLEEQLDGASGVFTAFGLVAAKVSWSKCAGGIRSVPKLQEMKVPVQTTTFVETPQGIIEIPTPALNDRGEPITEKRLVPVRDADGAEVFENKWHGDAAIEILTPFEYRRDPTSKKAEDAKYYQHIRLMDFDDFLKEYDEAEGMTRHYKQVRPGQFFGDAAYKYALRHYMRMSFVTPVLSNRDRSVFESKLKQDLIERKVLVIEHYDKPNAEKWPLGRKVVVVNGTCTHVSEPQFSTKKPGGWHPFVEAQWLNVKPSPMPTAPMNDVTSKNREINRLDSLSDTASMRNLGSMLLVKSGSGLDPQTMFGEPGQVHEVPNIVDVARWIRDDKPIDPVIEKLRQTKKDDSYEISGAQEALRGDRSKGATSGYMVKLLQEREEARLSPARRRFERFVSNIGEKLIFCIRANAAELGEDVFGQLKRSAAGEFTPSDIQAFLRTPLDFGVDISVVPGSMIAKSKASEQATLMDLVSNTSIGERLKNPQVMDRFLKFFDAELMRDDSSVHRDRAEKENEQFTDLGRLGPNATGVNIPLVMPMDDDDLHIMEHERDMVERAESLQSNPWELEIRMLHNEMHRIQKREKMGELAVGTTTVFPQMYGSLQQQQRPQVTEVLDAQQRKDDAQRMQQDQQKAQPQPPQGPSMPKPVGMAGPPPMNTATPAANTPAAAQGGPG